MEDSCPSVCASCYKAVGYLRTGYFLRKTGQKLLFCYIADVFPYHVEGIKGDQTAWILLNFIGYVKYHVKVRIRI